MTLFLRSSEDLDLGCALWPDWKSFASDLFYLFVLCSDVMIVCLDFRLVDHGFINEK